MFLGTGKQNKKIPVIKFQDDLAANFTSRNIPQRQVLLHVIRHLFLFFLLANKIFFEKNRWLHLPGLPCSRVINTRYTPAPEQPLSEPVPNQGFKRSLFTEQRYFSDWKPRRPDTSVGPIVGLSWERNPFWQSTQWPSVSFTNRKMLKSPSPEFCRRELVLKKKKNRAKPSVETRYLHYILSVYDPSQNEA